MFWFLGFVTVVIILIVQQSSAGERERKAYWHGRDDERMVIQQMVHQISQQREDQAISLVELGQTLGISFVQTNVNPQQATTETVASQAFVTEPVSSPIEPSGVTSAPDPIQPSYQPTFQPQLSDLDMAEEKERRTIKNLNILLYVGSFLVVSATALFVTLTMAPLVRLAGMILMTVVFYLSGLVLHQKSKRLRSAGSAFVGTGLAILPFIGIALSLLGGLPGEVSWLITSLVGVVAFTVATMILRSEFVSYATMAFIVSLAISVVPVMQLSVMWYFIAIMSVSMLVNLCHMLWPRLVPPVFARSLQTSGIIMTPIALVSSLFAVSSMGLWMYEILFCLATLHYLVLWGIKRSVVYELAVRVLAHGTLLIVGADLVGLTVNSQASGLTLGSVELRLSERLTIFGVIWLGLAVIQVVYSLLRASGGQDKGILREQVAVAISLALMFIATGFFAMNENWQLWVSVDLAVIAISCIAIGLRWREVYWFYGTLLVSAILPFLFGRGAVSPAWDYRVIGLMFAGLGALSLVALERATASFRSNSVRIFCLSATVTYSAMLALSGLLTERGMDIGWTMLLSAVVMVLASLVVRRVWAEVIGVIFGVISLAGWTNEYILADEWRITAVVVLSTAVILTGVVVHQYFCQSKRRDALAIIATIMLFGLLLNGLNGVDAVNRATVMLFLVAGVGMLIFRGIVEGRANLLRTTALVGYIAYPISGLLLALGLGEGWLFASLLASAGISWASSMVERFPNVTSMGHFALLLAVMQLWSWLDFNSSWFIYGTTWVSVTIYYLWYWLFHSRADIMRRDISFVAILIVLSLPALHGLTFSQGDKWAVASAISMIAGAVIIAVHGLLSKRLVYAEASVYIATLGLQRMVSVAIPGLSEAVYSHWWALTVLATAVWRKDYSARLIVGLSLITLPTGMLALSRGGGYIWVFLVEHLMIAMGGAMFRKQWAMWWGIVAVILSILYFIRNYTALMLLFLGFLLILFVVWRLLRSGQSKPD